MGDAMSKTVGEIVQGKGPLPAIEALANDALMEVLSVRQGMTPGLPRKGDERIRRSARFLAELGAEITRQACSLMAQHESGHTAGAKKGQETRRKNMDAFST